MCQQAITCPECYKPLQLFSTLLPGTHNALREYTCDCATPKPHKVVIVSFVPEKTSTPKSSA